VRDGVLIVCQVVTPHYVLNERNAAAGVVPCPGFKKVRNMKGGILAWSDKVDPSVPKY
jgi:rhodanese-related sulfurtransferase